MDDGGIASFMDITGADENVARTVLDMTDGDLSQACTLFFDNPDIASTVRQAAPAASNATQQPSRRARAGREDASGVIHIDSDEDDDEYDDDVDMLDDVESNDGRAVAAEAARLAQEDEDAAMAKRLQEELYSERGTGGPSGEGVRAPLARTTETLVAPTYGGMGDDSDMHDAMLEQLRRRTQRQAQARNPFAQNIWNDPDAPPIAPPHAGGPTAGPTSNTRAARLAELFRPPYDLMAPFSWDEARSEGKEEKKWILVNLQDMADFNCQTLNRDIWKDDAIKQLIQESFIFLQYSKDDPQAQEYVQFYLREGQHENPDNYPHVAIVDPRTGEQVKVWSGIPFPSALDFHAQLVEFLDRYSLSANSKNPVAKQSRPKTVDVDRMTEDEMLRMAMQNSLESAAGGGSPPKADIHDPDALTKSNADIGGKGKAAAEPVDLTGEGASGAAAAAAAAAAEPSASAGDGDDDDDDSAFAKIASDKPHTEPAHDPATTTRIQFRHPVGRVIRRFAVGDRVQRIYEWLKAEPLEGKEGVAFELKMMPQGRDLLEDLDKTIEEAGLKQGTVMIEFIQD